MLTIKMMEGGCLNCKGDSQRESGRMHGPLEWGMEGFHVFHEEKGRLWPLSGFKRKGV